ncbi:MAG: hypothetical protein HKN13_01375 [Rhodothermales bacterium]|nr:hypothetical protein [Rhodothermales bacterium]
MTNRAPRHIDRFDEQRLLKFLEGSLSDAEVGDLEEQLASDAHLRERLGELRSVATLLDNSKPESFAPYFSDRVMKRLTGQTTTESESLYDSLRWIFVRAAVACLLIAIVVGSYNIANYQSLEVADSLIEVLFGLPSATLSDALAYGSL